jgi:serine protein kinase
MSGANEIISLIQSQQDTDEFQQLNWKGTFEEYLGIVMSNPNVVRTAYQRIYDMIMSYGTEEYTEHKLKVIRYKFFDDVENDGVDAVYGLEVPLMKLVNVFKSAAQRLGTEKRIILLHGPVGSSKSTIVRRLKRGLEAYSKRPEGALYTFSWMEESEEGMRFIDSPMYEEPLKLIPLSFREEVEVKINAGIDDPNRYVRIEGELNPADRYRFNELMKEYDGDWTKVIQHIHVRRLILSEKDRVGVGTFQPKDEKNQDSTELTGDINYRKIAEYGSDSDPRAFNFDGEFNVANRGLIEFIEVLKLDVAFLYDLLGASQEHKIKPKKFSQTDIDEVIVGHTNEPEYRKLQNNEFMEALRDRTVRIDIPYITKLDNLRARLQPEEDTRHPYRAPYDRDGLDVGGFDPARGAQEGGAQPDAEAEAVQRADAPGIHRREHQGAEKGNGTGGNGGHFAAIYPGQDIQCARRRGGGRLHQPVHGDEPARSRPGLPLFDHLRRAAQTLPGAARNGEGRIRGHREKRGPEGHIGG